MDIMKCIQKIYPDWKGTVIDNSFDGILPDDKEKRIITLKEIKKVWTQVQKDVEIEQIQRKRQYEYPDIYEYIDGIVKNDKKQIDEYIQKCLEVKKRNPIKKDVE
jgi:hypothetical protein